MTFKNEAAKKILSQIDRHERIRINYEMDVYNSLLGHEGKQVEPLVQSAEEIYEYLFGEKIKPEAPDRAISGPTPTFTMSSGSRRSKSGPRGRRIGPRNEEIEIDVMVKAAQIYALLALDICDRERPIRK